MARFPDDKPSNLVIDCWPTELGHECRLVHEKILGRRRIKTRPQLEEVAQVFLRGQLCRRLGFQVVGAHLVV
ncbi:hypothetical protein [Hymenobacter nivis]|uniref:hypothetical protein n=1 Tax=Hymenobacter nivis TaxID=1850093 RepID=UPI0013A5662C|nr:hypothetical protein [Hymenobacter nivis]